MSSNLSTEEVQALEADHVLLSGPVNGKRKVSAALLSPPSTQGSLSSSSSGSISVSVRSPTHSISPFELPESAESVAAIEWCGFTRPMSGEIFARWSARPQPNPDGLLDYIRGHITQLNTQNFMAIQRDEAMKTLGISEELQAALTNPTYKQLYLSETLYFWVKDTVNTRYGTLIALLEKLKVRGVETVARRKGGKRAKITGAFDVAGTSSSASSQSQTMGSVIASAPSSASDTQPTTFVTIQKSPTLLPNHYTYFKGKAVAEMGFGELIRDDGNIRIDPIKTHGGGDFNQSDDAWYFSKEEGTAEKYRGYAAKRCPQSETWIINMQVPKGFIDGLRKKELWYSPDWKEFVWCCRKGDSVSSPAKFDSYHPPQTQFIEGHICGRNPAISPNIKKEDVQQEMGENDLLYLGTRKATQSVFVDKPTVVEMAKLLRGKIFVDVFPPSNIGV